MQAIFRGVRFFLETIESERAVLFQQENLAFSWTTPPIEVLGKAAPTHLIRAFVLNREDLDLLLKALSRRGSGTLIHPHLGVIDVVVVAWKVQQRSTTKYFLDFEAKETTEESSSILSSILSPLTSLENRLDELRLDLAETLEAVALGVEGLAQIERLAFKAKSVVMGSSGFLGSWEALKKSMRNTQTLPERLALKAASTKASEAFLGEAKHAGIASHAPQTPEEELITTGALVSACSNPKMSSERKEALLEALEALLNPASSPLSPAAFLTLQEAKSTLLALETSEDKAQIPYPMPPLVAEHHLGRSVDSKKLLILKGERV